MLPTNPYSIAVPGGERGPMVVDFATSKIAGGWIYAARSAGAQLPDNVLMDTDGYITRDPEDYFRGGAIMPSGEHKGYALAVFADIFAVSFYRHHAKWKILLRLLPLAVAGINLNDSFFHQTCISTADSRLSYSGFFCDLCEGSPAVHADADVAVPESSEGCVMCHSSLNPGILDHWEGSGHAEEGIGCYDCHAANEWVDLGSVDQCVSMLVDVGNTFLA